MGDPKKMTPLSGEIMADEARAGIGPSVAADVVDADVVTLPRAAATRPAAPRPTHDSTAPKSPAQNGLNVLMAGTATRGGSRRAGIGFWSAGALAALAAFWMSGGHALSRHLPLLRGDAQPMRIADLSSRVAQTATGPRLFIDGEVRNVAATSMNSPELMIDVIANDGIVTRYRLVTGTDTISEGETRRFSSRLAAPETGVRSVAVNIERKDPH